MQVVSTFYVKPKTPSMGYTVTLQEDRISHRLDMQAFLDLCYNHC